MPHVYGARSCFSEMEQRTCAEWCRDVAESLRVEGHDFTAKTSDSDRSPLAHAWLGYVHILIASCGCSQSFCWIHNPFSESILQARISRYHVQRIPLAHLYQAGNGVGVCVAAWDGLDNRSSAVRVLRDYRHKKCLHAQWVLDSTTNGQCSRVSQKSRVCRA